MSTPKSVNTVVIGGGHAGLTMSAVLQARNIDHVVLEAGEPLNQWRRLRWQSFRMNTPPQHHKLPGQDVDALPVEAGQSLADALAGWEQWIAEKKLPIRTHSKVVRVTRKDDSFVVHVSSENDGQFEICAKSVISSVGNYAKPRVPSELARSVPADVKQFVVGTYVSPASLPAGNVLVVGSGQTGVQLAHELASDANSERRVYLATSRVPGIVRTYRGDDLFVWLERIGFMRHRTADVPVDMRKGPIPITGADHPISLHSLSRSGATLLGRLKSIDTDGVAHFDAASLQAHVAFADATYHGLPALFEKWIDEHSAQDKHPPSQRETEWVPHDALLQAEPVHSLALRDANVTAILFASGFEPDFDWLDVDGARAQFVDGRPTTCTSDVKGLYFLGEFEKQERE